MFQCGQYIVYMLTSQDCINHSTAPPHIILSSDRQHMPDTVTLGLGSKLVELTVLYETNAV